MTCEKTKKTICPFCLEEHELDVKVETETTVFKGETVAYDAETLYCSVCDEYFEDEDIMNSNDIRMKDAYREKIGLLKSSDIVSIRERYGISQSDFCKLLGCGGKTITRYESHQVQDKAHDLILRKISDDPGWYMELLIESHDKISEKAYAKYLDIVSKLYEKSVNDYLREMIRANCSKYRKDPKDYGDAELSFRKIVDVINYYAASKKVKKLFKVKLMKMMWYADFLSYKRSGHSITGLPYLALPMGAVPESHNYLIDLDGVHYSVEIVNDNEAYHFTSKASSFPSLTDEDKKVLDTIIRLMGGWNAEEVKSYMHDEVAYKKTEKNHVISYDYAKYLSIE